MSRRSSQRSMGSELQELDAQLQVLSNALEATSAMVQSWLCTARAVHDLERDLWLQQIVDAEAHILHLTRRIEAREETLAHMVAELDRLHSMLALAADRLAERDATSGTRTALQHVCLCCFEDLDDAGAFVRCAAGHVVCRKCLATECRRLRSGRGTRPPTGVPCIAAIECRATIPYSECLAVDDGEALVKEVHLDAMREHILRAVRLGGDVDVVLTRLAFLRADGSYDAWACPRCGHGPLLHAFCSDLTEHHDTPVASDAATRYNNACPRCGALYADVRHLVPWTGTPS